MTTVPHRVRVTLNGLQVGELEYAPIGRLGHLLDSASLLKEGLNDVSLASLNGGSDISLIDYVRVTYRHTYKADNDALQFTSAGNELVSIGGFTATRSRLWM